MKSLIISLLTTIAIVGGAIFLLRGGTQASNPSVGIVNIINGTQTIDITAKSGYAPRQTTAQAGVPTILRVSTNSTYDCSSALQIPSINYAANLPPSGTTEIPIPPQKAGTTLRGICSMGMYNFAVNFN